MREPVSDQWAISERVGSDTGAHHMGHYGAHTRLNESAWLNELQLQASVRYIWVKKKLNISLETSIIMISNLKQRRETE